MPLTKNGISATVKIIVLIWGGVMWIKGAGFEFFIRENDPYLESELMFSNLVYGALFITTLLSFLSSWIASLILLLSAIASLAILVWTKTFGHGLSWAGPFMWQIALGPALGSLVFFVLSRWVKEPPVMERLRLLIRK